MNKNMSHQQQILSYHIWSDSFSKARGGKARDEKGLGEFDS